jgi:hypothetical protein
MVLKIIAALCALVVSAGIAAAQSCSNFPNILTNGQPADANQVMANFNFVANCVNNLTTANDAIINCTLQASVASNNLTVALKTNAGTDPTASNPCIVSFRNAVAATGNYVVVQVTSATSIVLNSGSSLGASSGIPFRVWVEGFNDGGTFRLAVSNQSVSTQIFPLNEAAAQSATQCSACSNATSAGVFYAPAPITSKAMRILGYMEWGNGLATAGAWASGPTLIQLFGPGIKKPGDVVQDSYMTSGTQTASNTAAPVPTAATLTMTPTSPVNKFRMATTGPVFNNRGIDVSTLIQFFRNNTVPLLPIGQCFSAAGAVIASVSMEVVDSPNTAAAVTYTVFLYQSGPGPGTGFFPFGMGSAPFVNMRLQEIMG